MHAVVLCPSVGVCAEHDVVATAAEPGSGRAPFERVLLAAADARGEFVEPIRVAAPHGVLDLRRHAFAFSAAWRS